MADGLSWNLRDAVEGSEVYLNDYEPRIERVVKATAVMVTLSDGTRWTRRGRKWGVGGGGYFRGPSACVVTNRATVEARIAELARERDMKRKRNELGDVRWSGFSDAFVEQMHALVMAEPNTHREER